MKIKKPPNTKMRSVLVPVKTQECCENSDEEEVCVCNFILMRNVVSCMSWLMTRLLAHTIGVQDLLPVAGFGLGDDEVKEKTRLEWPLADLYNVRVSVDVLLNSYF